MSAKYDAVLVREAANRAFGFKCGGCTYCPACQLRALADRLEKDAQSEHTCIDTDISGCVPCEKELAALRAAKGAHCPGCYDIDHDLETPIRPHPGCPGLAVPDVAGWLERHGLNELADEWEREHGKETPQHVCGLQGFQRGPHEAIYDKCPACEK